MGRPLKKDSLGTDAIGLDVNGNTGIQVSGYFGGSLSTAYAIIKQRGANTFVVAKNETFTADTTNGGYTLTSMSDQVEVTVGDEISGTGIPTGTRVASIDSATQVTMTNAATADGTGVTVTHHGAYQVGKLVDTTPNANGEIQMLGYVGGNALNNLVPVAKITRRLAYGFPSSPVLSGGFNRGEDDNTSTNHDATRYTWKIENDSSADILVLTAI